MDKPDSPCVVAYSRGVVVNPATFEPNLDVRYQILTAQDPDITLDEWIRIVSGHDLNGLNVRAGIAKGKLIPLVRLIDIVPWLVRGLKEAVRTNSTRHLQDILFVVREYGHKDTELDILEKSLNAAETTAYPNWLDAGPIP